MADAHSTPIVTLAEARQKGLKRYFTGNPCGKGHVTERLTSDRSCMECNRIKRRARYPKEYRERGHIIRDRNRLFYHENLDTIKPRRLRYRESRREELATRQRRYYRENRDARTAYNTQYRQLNYARLKEAAREWYQNTREVRSAYGKAYYLDNREKYAAWVLKRKRAMAQAIPPWYDAESTACFYQEARRLTEHTSVLYHVDHIIPLQNPRVCGLHTADNLQVLPASDNLAKHNSFDPDAHVHTLPDQTQLRCRTG